MSYIADFHIHSCYSDGQMKPVDIVRMYKDKEYDMIALTDHDGVDGVKEAKIAGEALKIEVISGIELATAYAFQGKEIELHILGYYIDIENERLTDRLKDIREQRAERNEKLLAYLNSLGYPLTFEDLIERPGQTYIGKPNFARAIARKGYQIENLWETLDRVKKEMISTEEGIDLLRGAGGIAVLAHPLRIKGIGAPGSDEFWENLHALLRDLKKKGLKGLECYHPSADHEQSLKLVSYAEKYHLHITEGSDFHGRETEIVR